MTLEYPRGKIGWIPLVLVQGDALVSESNPLEVQTSATVTSETEVLVSPIPQGKIGEVPVTIINADEEVSSINKLSVRFV